MHEFPGQIPKQETESPKENPAEVKTDIPPVPEETVVDTPQPTEADFSAKVAELENTLGIPLSDEAKNDIHKNMIGEATGRNNIENPTPTTEKEPRFPSLEEVIAQMKTLIGQEDLKEERRKENEDGVQLYEVSIMENLNGHEITHVYTYRKADGNRVLVTSIGVAYCDGSPDDNDWLPGGHTVLEYDELTRTWNEAGKKKSVEKTDAIVEKAPDARQEQLTAFVRAATTDFLPPEERVADKVATLRSASADNGSEGTLDGYCRERTSKIVVRDTRPGRIGIRNHKPGRDHPPRGRRSRFGARSKEKYEAVSKRHHFDHRGTEQRTSLDMESAWRFHRIPVQ